MDSHEVIRQVIDKVSPKEIASKLGVSLSLVYKWSQPDENTGSGTANPLDRVRQLFEIAGDEHLIQWLCHKAGGVFVKNSPPRRRLGMEVMPVTQEIVQQFANLLAAISNAASDNSITTTEAAHIRHVWDELKRFTEGFVKCCEQGDFEHLSEDMKKVHFTP